MSGMKTYTISEAARLLNITRQALGVRIRKGQAEAADTADGLRMTADQVRAAKRFRPAKTGPKPLGSRYFTKGLEHGKAQNR